MEKHGSKTDRSFPFQSDPGIEVASDQVKELQRRILKRTAQIPDDNRITIKFVREFELAGNWAEVLSSELENDSVYRSGPGSMLPGNHNPEQILQLYRKENTLSQCDESQMLSQSDKQRVSERLRHYRLKAVDSAIIDVMYDACNWVVIDAITEENCLRELAKAQDSVQRAELLMMMGRDVEAFREFSQISPEEINNPENALALVELVERYESPKSALKILKRWFLLEIVLHSLPFDLVGDLISDRKQLELSPRVRYLQSILLHTHEMKLHEITQQLTLVLPDQTEVIPELTDVNLRLKRFGLSMKRLDLMLDEGMPVNLFTLMSNLTDQLIHAAELARHVNNSKFAVQALERAVLSCFVLLNLPESSPDAFMEFFDHIDEQQLTGQMVLETLDDIEELLEEILIFIDSDIQHHMLGVQIAALRRYIKRLNNSSQIGNSDGLSSMPGKYGRH